MRPRSSLSVPACAPFRVRVCPFVGALSGGSGPDQSRAQAVGFRPPLRPAPVFRAPHEWRRAHRMAAHAKRAWAGLSTVSGAVARPWHASQNTDGQRAPLHSDLVTLHLSPLALPAELVFVICGSLHATGRDWVLLEARPGAMWPAPWAGTGSACNTVGDRRSQTQHGAPVCAHAWRLALGARGSSALARPTWTASKGEKALASSAR